MELLPVLTGVELTATCGAFAGGGPSVTTVRRHGVEAAVGPDETEPRRSSSPTEGRGA